MIFTFNCKVRPNDIVALKSTKYGAKNSIFLGPKLQSHLPQNKTSETNLLTSFRNIMNPHMDLNVDAISLQIFDCFSLQIFHKFYIYPTKHRVLGRLTISLVTTQNHFD